MSADKQWRAILASALDWEQAHITLDKAVAGLAPALRGRRHDPVPHSVWELLEHIRLAQYDLLDFMRNPAYEEPSWPTDYWPAHAAPPSDTAWTESIARIVSDRRELTEFATSADLDLTRKIPHGTGQTYLRTILVAVDHTAYHVGQIVVVRRLLGAWPPA